MKQEKLRPGQASAFDVCMKRLKEGESHTSIVLPTRYGKSDLMRLVAYEASRIGLISGAIALSPYDNLTVQLIKTERIQEMAMRYGLDYARARRVRQLKSFSEIRPFSNGEYFLAANIQLAYEENIHCFRQLVDAEKWRTKLSMVLFIDECQFVAETQKWGTFLHEAAAAGCLLILVTATPIREDAQTIPGFSVDVIDEKDEQRWFCSDAGDGTNNRIDLWTGCRELVRLRANHETTFKEAWNEKPSPLCHLNREVIDIGVAVNGNDECLKLSELSEYEQKKYLGKVTRDPTFVEHGVRKMLEQLATQQRTNKKCAAIVFTGNDQSSSKRDNEHAEMVKEFVESIGQRYLDHEPLTVIVTMKNQNPRDEARAASGLAEFVGDENNEGRGDVLIVKQIGGVGLDCPRLKVLLDLSPVRTVATVVQRLTRVATPYNGMEIGYVITAKDARMEALWKRLIVEEGGELDKSDLWIRGVLLDSHLKPKPEPTIEVEPRMGATELAGFDDSLGNTGRMENYTAVQSLLMEFPELAMKHTKPQLAEKVSRLTFLPAPISPKEQIQRSLTIDIKKLQEEIFSISKEIVNIQMRLGRGGPYDREEYGERMQAVWEIAYQNCGLSLETNLRNIIEIKTLEKLKQEMERQRDYATQHT